tara:strand:- start:362 stop:688 length:327 start_codon:yes stop_codon:yes gene_type:complete
MSIYQASAYSFGQMGSAYLNDTSIFEPPAGKVIVSILSLDDNTAFTKLESVDNDESKYFSTTGVNTNATNADALDTTETFPAGIAIFGRWNKVQLNGTNRGVILYFGY